MIIGYAVGIIEEGRPGDQSYLSVGQYGDYGWVSESEASRITVFKTIEDASVYFDICVDEEHKNSNRLIAEGLGLSLLKPKGYGKIAILPVDIPWSVPRKLRKVCGEFKETFIY